MPNSTDWLFTPLTPAMESPIPTRKYPVPKPHVYPNVPTFRTTAEVDIAIAGILAHPEKMNKHGWYDFRWCYKDYYFYAGIKRGCTYDCKCLDAVIRTIPEAFDLAFKYLTSDVTGWWEDEISLDEIMRQMVIGTLDPPIETNQKRRWGAIEFSLPEDIFGGHWIMVDCDLEGSRIRWSHPALVG